ncbi:hypothetical protein SJA_C1-21270 [Sphingobium indicum UT26S]|uniref:Uncharacterized protein n=1 Tax=Sphingobium indicum (strain DSM 16413 / CCM 7287 / MTCC 6362 / UT26 / NBRC 101211 / UT26S) TaxID=452662 RepID=D4Z2X9_SPHIU|nr:hypothetical protein SJA_C1-21270 [Sphingobium indicum UT26S]
MPFPLYDVEWDGDGIAARLRLLLPVELASVSTPRRGVPAPFHMDGKAGRSRACVQIFSCPSIPVHRHGAKKHDAGPIGLPCRRRQPDSDEMRSTCKKRDQCSRCRRAAFF